MSEKEINPDDFEMEYDDEAKSEEEEISGSSERENIAIFNWKGVDYEVELLINETWHTRNTCSDRDITIENERPKDIPENEWDEIKDWILEEVR